MTVTVKDNNAHISMHALSVLLAAELARHEEDIGCRLVLEPLGKLKTGADNTTMALIRNVTGQPMAVIGCSRPASPDLIQRGVEAAEATRGLIGERLGSAIIKPISSGYVAGRSYVILPWYREFSSWKPRRLLQRRLLRPPLLSWLRDATMAAAAQERSAAVTESYLAVLQHLGRQDFLTAEMRVAVDKAAARLDGRQWLPVHTFDHNDFWLGNVMLPARTGNSLGHPYPFVLIDWAGANPRGYGLYDLIRLARALKLSPAALRRELLSHSKALKCDPTDTCGHLLAALGRLHQHLEYFPEERFVETFRSCWDTMKRAMPEAG